MGLTKLNKVVVLKDTPETRGMIKKVSHLVEVIE
jgi:large subunit ribosomal protein L30